MRLANVCITIIATFLSRTPSLTPNLLPKNIRKSTSITIFKRSRKTFLFQQIIHAAHKRQFIFRLMYYTSVLSNTNSIILIVIISIIYCWLSDQCWPVNQHLVFENIPFTQFLQISKWSRDAATQVGAYSHVQILHEMIAVYRICSLHPWHIYSTQTYRMSSKIPRVNGIEPN